ncbi:MAG: NADH-quinone oxidoreductase subunit A [Acidimicrobiales bacterium]
MDQYLPLVVMVVLAVLFGVVSEMVSKLVSPKRSTPAKTAPYECGIVPRRGPPERFPVRFYLVAMIFIIFDIEVIFLYPYAVIFRGLGAFGLAELVLFSIPVFFSFVYLIANGALDWGPIKVLRAGGEETMVSSARTTTTTIRRVGMDGRAAGDEAA